MACNDDLKGKREDTEHLDWDLLAAAAAIAGQGALKGPRPDIRR